MLRHLHVDTEPHLAARRHTPKQFELFLGSLLNSQVGRPDFVSLGQARKSGKQKKNTGGAFHGLPVASFSSRDSISIV
jgi:hypothetical protein